MDQITKGAKVRCINANGQAADREVLQLGDEYRIADVRPCNCTDLACDIAWVDVFTADGVRGGYNATRFEVVA